MYLTRRWTRISVNTYYVTHKLGTWCWGNKCLVSLAMTNWCTWTWPFFTPHSKTPLIHLRGFWKTLHKIFHHTLKGSWIETAEGLICSRFSSDLRKIANPPKGSWRPHPLLSFFSRHFFKLYPAQGFSPDPLKNLQYLLRVFGEPWWEDDHWKSCYLCKKI